MPYRLHVTYCCLLLTNQCESRPGALGLPDIGQLFPDNDPEWSGADSSVFMEEAYRRMQLRGFRVGNVDVTLILQKPKVMLARGHGWGSNRRVYSAYLSAYSVVVDVSDNSPSLQQWNSTSLDFLPDECPCVCMSNK